MQVGRWPGEKYRLSHLCGRTNGHLVIMTIFGNEEKPPPTTPDTLAYLNAQYCLKLESKGKRSNVS